MRALLLILFVVQAVAGFGQDKKATKILDRLNSNYSKAQTLTITFDLKITYPEEQPIVLPSRVVQKGRKFVFKNKDQEYYGNGDDIWVYLPERNEVQINDFDEEEADDYFITPLDLLNQYSNGEYEYQLVNSTKTSAEVEFKPIDEFSDYSKFRINIDTKANEVIDIIGFGKDGSRADITITSLKRDLDYSDAFFEFDAAAHPGIHIEDLRLD